MTDTETEAGGPVYRCPEDDAFEGSHRRVRVISADMPTRESDFDYEALGADIRGKLKEPA